MDGAKQACKRQRIAFEAKNESGGYAGSRMYGAVFREGKGILISSVQLPGKDGFDGLSTDRSRGAWKTVLSLPTRRCRSSFRKPHGLS